MGLGALIPLSLFVPAALILVPVFVAMGAMATIGNITQWTLRQSMSPPHLQGRMTAVFRTIFWGGWPLGNLIGGVAAGLIGVTTVLWLGPLLALLINCTIFFTPLWKVRDFGSILSTEAPPPEQPVAPA